MIVELVATVARLSAMPARVDKRAGEVNILDMLAQVALVRAGLAAQCAAMRTRPSRRTLFNVGIEHPVRI